MIHVIEVKKGDIWEKVGHRHSVQAAVICGQGWVDKLGLGNVRIRDVPQGQIRDVESADDPHRR